MIKNRLDMKNQSILNTVVISMGLLTILNMAAIIFLTYFSMNSEKSNTWLYIILITFWLGCAGVMELGIQKIRQNTGTQIKNNVAIYQFYNGLLLVSSVMLSILISVNLIAILCDHTLLGSLINSGLLDTDDHSTLIGHVILEIVYFLLAFSFLNEEIMKTFFESLGSLIGGLIDLLKF